MRLNLQLFVFMLLSAFCCGSAAAFSGGTEICSGTAPAAALAEFGCDNFDSYFPGCFIDCQASSDWTFWGGSGSGTDAAVSSAYAYSGNRSLRIYYDNVNYTDILRDLGNETAGRYRLAWEMYIPAGKSAYYAVMTAGTGTVTEAYRVIFADNGEVTFSPGNGNGNPVSTAPFPHNSWFSVSQIIDFDLDIAEVFIDDEYAGSFSYSGSAAGPTQLGRLNFYSNSVTRECYIDDLCYLKIEPANCPLNIAPVCVKNGTQYDNACIAGTYGGYVSDEWESGPCGGTSDPNACDNFENYSPGSTTPLPPVWENFYNNPASAATVDGSFGYQSSQSLRLDSDNSSFSDVIYQVNEFDPVVTRIEWQVYLPAGGNSRWGVLYDYDASASSSSFAYRCYLENGTGNLFIGGFGSSVLTSFTYSQNQWVSIVTIINAPEDKAELWIDNEFIADWTYSAGSPSGPPLHSVDVVNIWNGGGASYWIDDFCTAAPNCPELDPCFLIDTPPVCVNGVEYGTECLAECDGYTAAEWTAGGCNGGGYGCNDCTDCFFYLHDDENPQTVSFYNNFCLPPNATGEDDNSSSFAGNLNPYKWEVQNSSGQVIMMDFNAQPTLDFLNPGDYTVCFFRFVTGDNFYDEICCLDIFVPQNPCNNPPVCNVEYTWTGGNNFQFDAGATTGADAYEWTWEGAVFATSASDQDGFTCGISSGASACYEVCVTATNECGFSNYCVMICPQSLPSCDPVPTDIPNINPQINGSEVTFSGIPTGGGWQYAWNAANADYENGTAATSANPVLSYDAFGNYIVCLTLTKGDTCEKICLCWTIVIGEDNCGSTPCSACTDPNCPDISFDYGGSVGNETLNYNFSYGSENGDAGFCRWEISAGVGGGTPIYTGTDPSLNYTFGQPGIYTVCYYYYNPQNGNLFKCCRTVNIGFPFACGNEDIRYNYLDNNQFNFTLQGQSAATNITWHDDDNNVQIGTGFTSGNVSATCSVRNFSVKYRDGNGYWRICCISVYLCAPTQCEASVTYDWNNTANQYEFTLNSTGIIDVGSIVWTDDNTGQEFGFGQTTAAYPFALPGGPRSISVRYRLLNQGYWRSCCRVVWLGSPTACGLSNIDIVPTSGNNYSLSIGNTLTDVSWEINGNAAGSNNVVSGNFNEGQSYYICVYYRDPGTGCWYVCCRTFTPTACTAPTANFTASVSDLTASFTNLSTSAEGGDSYLWDYGDGNQSTNYAAPHTYGAGGTYTVCLTVTDNCTSVTFCSPVTVATGSGVTFDAEDDVCGSPGSTVSVPIRVRDFNNLVNFEYTIELLNSGVATVVGHSNPHPSLSALISAPSANKLAVSWLENNLNPISLPDNTIAFYIDCQITGSIGASTAVEINSSITAVNAGIIEPNGSIVAIPVTTENGSLCVQQTNAALSGIVHRLNSMDGTYQPINEVEVAMTGDAAQTVTTAQDGLYAFLMLNPSHNVTVKPEKNTGVKNGINGLDMAMIRSKILGNDLFTNPYQYIAADANNDGLINGIDLANIRQVILVQATSFINNTSWRFIPQDYVFINPGNPLLEDFPEEIDYNPVSAGGSNQNFIAVKIGDVNTSANTMSLTGGSEADNTSSFVQNAFTLTAAEVSGSPGEVVTVDFTTENFIDLIGLEYTTAWDVATATMQGEVYNFHPNIAGKLTAGSFSYAFTDEGKLPVSWLENNLEGQNVPAGEVLYSIDFLLTGAPEDCSVVEFTDDPTDITIADANLESVEFIGESGEICVAENFEDLTATINIIEPDCFGETGSLGVLPSGGSGNYEYLWSNGVTLQALLFVSVGTYAVTVTDTQTEETFVIDNIIFTQPSPLTANITTTPATVGTTNGSATVTAAGGTPGYTYLWNDFNMQTTAQASGLAAGNYQITVTDANECTEVQSATVENTASDISVNFTVTDISCAGGDDGSITATAAGGSENFSYYWSTDATTPTVGFLTEGTYGLTVTDEETGVELDETVYVGEPEALNLQGSVTDDTDNSGTGAATVSASGGTPPYDYLWNDDAAQTTATAVGLTAGVYTVTVTDGNDCTKTAALTIDNITSTENPSDISEEITLLPNPAQNYLTVSTEVALTNPVFSLYSVGGRLLSVPQTQTGGGLYTLHIDLPDGVYIIRVQTEERIAHKRFVVQR